MATTTSNRMVLTRDDVNRVVMTATASGSTMVRIIDNRPPRLGWNAYTGSSGRLSIRFLLRGVSDDNLHLDQDPNLTPYYERQSSIKDHPNPPPDGLINPEDESDP